MMPQQHFYLINSDQYQADFALRSSSGYLSQLTRIQGKWTVSCYEESENDNKDDGRLGEFFFFFWKSKCTDASDPGSSASCYSLPIKQKLKQ